MDEIIHQPAFKFSNKKVSTPYCKDRIKDFILDENRKQVVFILKIAYTTKRGDKYDGEYRYAGFYDRGKSEFF